MGVLNLRDVPDELMRELRAQAALEGSQFHPFCKELLKWAVHKRRSTSLPPDRGAVFGGEFNMLDHMERGILEPMPSTAANPSALPPGHTPRVEDVRFEPADPNQEIEIT